MGVERLGVGFIKYKTQREEGRGCLGGETCRQRYHQECKGPRIEKSLVPSEVMRKSRAEEVGESGVWADGMHGLDLGFTLLRQEPLGAFDQQEHGLIYILTGSVQLLYLKRGRIPKAEIGRPWGLGNYKDREENGNWRWRPIGLSGR